MVEELSALNQIQTVEQVDNQDSNVAGGAAVEPSYISSSEDLINTQISIDPVDTSAITSNSVSSSPASGTQAASAPDEGPNYIENTTLASPSDEINDTGIEDVLTISNYVDPSDPAVQDLLSQLKDEGIIHDGMSSDEIALAVYNYLVENFDYVADAEADIWQTVSSTIAAGGGDCEDLSFLLSSLLIAALVDSGMSPEEANERVMGVAVNLDSGDGHIFVAYTTDSGGQVVLDPSASNETLDTVDSAAQADLSSDEVLFTFNDTSVEVVDENYDYSDLSTSSGAIITPGPGGTIVVTPDEPPPWTEILAGTIEALEYLLDGHIDGFFWQNYVSGQGFWGIDASELEGILNHATALASVLSCVAMMAEENIAERQTMLQNIADIEPTFKDSKMVENASKTANLKVSTIQSLIIETFQNVMEHNNDYYQHLLDAALDSYESQMDEATDDWYDGFYSGDDIDAAEDYAEAVQEAAQQYNAATDAMLAEMQQIFGSMMGDGGGDIFSTMDALAGNILNGLMGSIVSVGNGYVDMVGTDQIRHDLGALANIYRTVTMLRLSMSDERNIIEETMTGRVGWTGSREVTSHMLESKINHWFELFEMTKSLLMQKVQLINIIQDLEYELEKIHESRELSIIADIITAIANILGVIATIVCAIFAPAAIPGIMLALAAVNMMTAAMRYQAAQNAYNVDDAFNPVQSSSPTAVPDTTTSSSSVNAMGEAEEVENNIINQANNNALQSIEDGYLGLNYDFLAELQVRLSKIQNVMRVLHEMAQFDHNARRTMIMLLAGVGSQNRGYGEFSKASLNSHFSEMNSRLQTRIFDLQQIQMAHNMERADEIAMQNATAAFVGQIVGSIIGAVIGTLTGGLFGFTGPLGMITAALVGFNMGSMFGQSLAEVYNARFAPGSSINADFSSMSTYFAQQAQQNANNSNLNAQLDQLENQIFQQMMNSGIVDSGGGFSALNMDLLIQLRKLLQMLQNVRECLAALHKSKAQDRAIMNESISGTPSEVIDIETDAVRAQAQTEMQVFSLLSRFLQETVEVMNRANEAEQRAELATENLIINIVVSTIMLATGGILGPGLGTTIVCLTPSMMQLATTVNNVLHLQEDATEDLGYFQHYNPAANLSQSINQYDADSIYNQLQSLENQIYNDITPSLIEDLGRGMWGMNMGFASYYQNQMERVFNIQKVLAMMNKAMKDERASMMRNLAGVQANAPVDIQEAAVNNAMQSALELIDLMFQGLQVICQRHNQITAAQRQLWMQLTQLAIQVVMIVAEFATSYLKEVKKPEVENMPNQTADGSPNGNKTALMEALRKSQRMWYGIQASAKVIQMFSNQLVADLFDDTRERKSSRGPRGPMSNTSSSTGNNAADQLNQMSSQQVSYQMSAGTAQLEMQAIDLDIQLHNERRANIVAAMAMLPGLAQSVANFIETLIKDAGASTQSTNEASSAPDPAEVQVPPPVAPEAAAPANNAANTQSAGHQHYLDLVSRSKSLDQRITILEQQVEAKKTEIANTKDPKKLEQLREDLRLLQQELAKEQKIYLELEQEIKALKALGADRTLLTTEIDELNQKRLEEARKRDDNNLKIKRLEKSLEGKNAEERAEIQREIDFLQGEVANSEQKIISYQNEINAKTIQLDTLNELIKIKEGKLAETGARIRDLNTKIGKLMVQIKALERAESDNNKDKKKIVKTRPKNVNSPRNSEGSSENNGGFFGFFSNLFGGDARQGQGREHQNQQQPDGTEVVYNPDNDASAPQGTRIRSRVRGSEAPGPRNPEQPEAPVAPTPGSIVAADIVDPAGVRPGEPTDSRILQLLARLDQIEKSLNTEPEFVLVTDTHDRISSSGSQKLTLENLSAELQEVKGKIDTYYTKIKEARTRISELKGELTSLNNQIKGLNADINALEKELEKMKARGAKEEDIKKLEARIRAKRNELADAESRIGEIDDEITALESDIQTWRGEIRELVPQMNNLARAIDELEGQNARRRINVGPGNKYEKARRISKFKKKTGIGGVTGAAVA